VSTLVDMARFPWVRRQVPSPRYDGTVAEDDAMVERLTACLLCGRRPEVLAIDRVAVGALALSIARCLRCRNTDPTDTRLDTLLEQRYRENRYVQGQWL